MPRTIRFSTPHEEFALNLSSVEERLFQVVRERALSKDGSFLRKIFWWEAEIRPRSVPQAPLLEEVRAVVREIERDSERLAYTYSHSARTTDAYGTVFHIYGSHLSSGLRLAGDPLHYYAINSGIGVCDLQKWGIGWGSRGELLETMDCRHQKVIETENLGSVVIKKRKIKSNLGKHFADLEAFLGRQTTESIDVFSNDG